jgi:methyl coenzyme M reductase beta subunit
MYTKAKVEKVKPLNNVEKEKSMMKVRNSMALNLEKIQNPLE